MMRFELFKDSAGEWRFRLIARNGETVAQSEGYKRKIDAQNTINSIRTGAPKARVIVEDEQ